MIKKISKKSFTLIEMIIVIAILGILAGIGINTLSWWGADKYYSEVCVNTLYGEIANFVYKASTSQVTPKALQNWYKEAPITYNIKKIENGKTLQLVADYETEQVTEQTLNTSEIIACAKKEKYKVNMHTDFDTIQMLPSLISKGNQNGFTIKNNNNTLSTGAVDLQFCAPASATRCKDFAQIIFDARTAMVKKRFCKLYDLNDDKKCRQRDTGD